MGAPSALSLSARAFCPRIVNRLLSKRDVPPRVVEPPLHFGEVLQRSPAVHVASRATDVLVEADHLPARALPVGEGGDVGYAQAGQGGDLGDKAGG
ncbi:hypothetical protein NKR19_g1307 [Coniochaeta hoffmannii]|uniref:Uncharacterized protein n=1 Tax=Coniochaeta hoffmannii TaxID=91930 RepID=A0AA38W0Y1_9PEZI|nr:hypothetical protein NKR19_g1307 [Coniochaeta hoffmannii]